ncbi:MAG: hypothetical protein H6669_15850 [Ardenticatenaceae bacterium]|nr:hypothetical protein [Ardenticatenaceae bacterium]
MEATYLLIHHSRRFITIHQEDILRVLRGIAPVTAVSRNHAQATHLSCSQHPHWMHNISDEEGALPWQVGWRSKRRLFETMGLMLMARQMPMAALPFLHLAVICTNMPMNSVPSSRPILSNVSLPGWLPIIGKLYGYRARYDKYNSP